MCGKDAAVAVDEREFGLRNLAIASLAAELCYGFDDVIHATGGSRMTVREQTAMRVAGQLTAKSECASERGRAGRASVEKAD